MSLKLMRSAMACLFGAACMTAGADSTDVATWTGTGLFTAETVEAFGTGTDAFPLGNGMIKYTGPSATLDRPIAIAVDGGRAATVRVTDPETTLTISKPVTQTSGVFIKDGPGTLRLTGTGPNVLGKTRTTSGDNVDLVWDETTGQLVSTGGYAYVTLNEGRLILGGEGQTNTVIGMNWIGSRTQKSTRLDVVGGVLTHTGDWFCLARGAGQTTNDVTATVDISGGATVSLGSLCLNYENGTVDYYGRSRLNIENATVTAGNVFLGEGTGEPRVYVGPGGALYGTQKNGVSDSFGFQIGRFASAKADLVVNGGTVGFHTGYLRAGSTLVITNGGTLKMDTTHKRFVNAGAAAGNVFVDNATIMPYSMDYSGTLADWFNQHSGLFTVGAGGVTFHTPNFGHLGAVPTNSASGASITKTGAGVFTLAPNGLPVTVREGTLRMSVSPQGWTNALTGAITLDAGAKLEVSGDRALGAMTVNADAAQFDAFGLERVRTWGCVNYARWTNDGFLYPTDGKSVWTGGDNTGDTGSVVALTNRPVRVDRSFELAFETYLATTTSRTADAWSVFFKKDSAARAGTSGRSGFGGVTDSFGVTVDVYSNRVRFGTNGVYTTSVTAPSGFAYYSTRYAAKCQCRLVYDATAKSATFTLRNGAGEEYSWTYAVDLAACIGSETAYLSFGGGSGLYVATFAFSNVRFVSDAPAVTEAVRVGGAKTLDAGETFAATLRPNELVNGTLMGRLDYADGATLDVATVEGASTGTASPAFFGFERYAGAGTLVKTGAADLGLVDDAAKDVALRLAGGGLRLRREREEDVVMGDAPHGWTFSHPSGRYLANGIQIGASGEYHRSTAQLHHRVRVDGDWDCSFSMWINEGYRVADAVSLFFHNDPRGPQCVGGSTSGAGYSGIQNGFPIAWYFFRDNSAAKHVVAGSTDYTGKGQSHAPLDLRGNTTDIALAYRAAEKTLTCIMTQGATVVTNTFTGIDIASAVKDTSAWMGFGVGCGGFQATPRITNFRFARCATEAAADQNAARYLASVAVAEDATVRLETTKSNAVFRVADAVTVADGKTLTAVSLNAPATLAMGTLTLGAESALAGDGATVVSPDAVAGALGTLTLKGVTLAVSEATCAARSLAESAVTLTDGAKLAAPAGRPLSVRTVSVDGVKQSAGVYTADTTDWVASGSVTLGGGTVLLLR